MKTLGNLFLSTLPFYTILLIVPNTKIVTLVFFVFWIVLSYQIKNFKIALLYAYVASWPINIGKEYLTEFITAIQLNIPLRTFGIGSSFVIGTKEFFVIAMLLVLIRENFVGKKRVFVLDRVTISLFLFFCFLIITSLIGSLRADISIIHSMYYIKPIIFYWYLRLLETEKKNLSAGILILFVCSIFLESFLTIMQILNQSTLGTAIEENEFLPIDISQDAASAIFRPVGTFSHANWLANHLLPYTLLLIPIIFSKNKKTATSLFFSWILSLIVILLTLSRSAWISITTALLTFLYVVEKRWHYRLQMPQYIKRTMIISLPLMFIIAIFFVLPRLTGSLSSFQVYGSAHTRFLLTTESVDAIKGHPIWGIGLGMEVYYYYLEYLQKGLQSVQTYFPNPVHNGYLSMAVQAGILATLLYLGISWALIQPLLEKPNKPIMRIYNLSVILAVAVLYINALFQPALPDLQIIMLLSIIGKKYYENI